MHMSQSTKAGRVVFVFSRTKKCDLEIGNQPLVPKAYALPSLAKVTVCPALEAHVFSGLFALPALILALLPFRVVHVDAIIVRCARVLVGEHLY